MASRPSMSILGDRESRQRKEDFVRQLDGVIRSLPLAPPLGFPSMSRAPASLHSHPTVQCWTLRVGRWTFVCEAHSDCRAGFRSGDDAQIRTGVSLGKDRQWILWDDWRSGGLWGASR